MRKLGVVAAAAAATVALGVAVGLGIGGWDFVAQHTGTLVAAAAMLVAVGTLVARLGAGLVRGAVLAVRRPRQMGQSGAAAAEFVITVVPFLLLLFGVMQMAMASMARVLVSYSAFCAARAAIVFVPEAPAEVEGNVQKVFTGTVKQAFTSEMENKVGAGSDTRTDFSVSAKAALLRNAAAYALIPASPSIDVVVADTARGWPQYWTNRLHNGLSPIDWIKSTIGDLGSYPSAVLDSFSDQVKDAIKNVIGNTESKEQAQKKLEDWVNKLPKLSQAQKDKLIAAGKKYIDDYKSAEESPTGKVGDWVKDAINDTLSGPLDKFKDQVNQAIDGSLSSAFGGATGAGGNDGFSVGHALDEGFGAGTDGATGALLRSLRKLVYARIATVVTLHDPKTHAYKSSFEWGDPIEAKVTYLFYCQVPLANRFAGHAFYNLPDTTVMDLSTGALGPAAAVGIPGHFMALTATHVMTNQGKPL